MHSLSLLACLVASSMIAGVNSALIRVQVGKNSTGQLDTVFNPNQVTAQVGDQIQFEFLAKNHTATQSSFAEPCTRQLNTALNLAGASSGFMPVAANATEIPTFTIQVNDASSPQWFFCNQANHCNLGMVFSINAPATGSKTFAAFLANAKTANHPDPALNQTAPFTPPAAPAAASPSDTSSLLPSSTSSNSTTPDGSSNSTTPDGSSNSTSPDGGAPSPTDVPANAAPDVSSSSAYGSPTYAGLSLSLANGSPSVSSPTAAGTGTAAQDLGGASSTLSGTAFVPGSTTSRSAGSRSRLSVGGRGVELGVFMGIVLGALVL